MASEARGRFMKIPYLKSKNSSNRLDIIFDEILWNQIGVVLWNVEELTQMTFIIVIGYRYIFFYNITELKF